MAVLFLQFFDRFVFVVWQVVFWLCYSLSATFGIAAVWSEMTLLYCSTCLLSRWKRVHIRSFNSESWCSTMSILLTSVLTMFLEGEHGFSRVFLTLFFERDLAILAFSSLLLWLTSLRWWKRIRALTNCSSAWLLMALISLRKVSSGVTFAFALYWSDFRQVFSFKCLSSLSMEVSVFCFLNSKALMASSCFLFFGCHLYWLFLGRFSCAGCLPLWSFVWLAWLKLWWWRCLLWLQV